MKKLFKSFISLTIALVLVLPIVLLTGCSKKYTVNVSVAAGEGQVLLKQSTMEAGNTSPSVVGKNSVAEGESFEFYVKPNTGWKIKSVKKDGEEIAIEDDDKISGYYVSLSEVKADHKVEVEFEKVTYTVTLKCKDGDQYVQYGDVIEVKYKESVNFEEYGGTAAEWYLSVASTKEYLSNHQNDLTLQLQEGYTANVLGNIARDWVVYTDKTAAELDDIINGESA